MHREGKFGMKYFTTEVNKTLIYRWHESPWDEINNIPHIHFMANMRAVTAEARNKILGAEKNLKGYKVKCLLKTDQY